MPQDTGFSIFFVLENAFMEEFFLNPVFPLPLTLKGFKDKIYLHLTPGWYQISILIEVNFQIRGILFSNHFIPDPIPKPVCPKVD
jgi:hypothetical protein